MNIKETLQFIFNSFKFWFIVNPWESSIRVRFGKNQTLLQKGIYFKIPYFDRIYTEEIRLRIMTMPIQSISTKDKKTITIKCAIGYKITDVLKMYNTIHQPETTISNIAMDKITSYLMSIRLESLDKENLISTVLNELSNTNYGISFDYIKVVSICEVQTYRLIQDQHWENESLQMEEVF